MDAPVTRATENEPTPPQSHQSEGFSFSRYLLSFIIAVIVYALSPGPIGKCIKLIPNNRPAVQVFAIAYAPLVLFCQNVPAAYRFYDWYMNRVWHVS